MNPIRSLVAGAAALLVIALSPAAFATVVSCTPVGVAEIHGDSSGATNRVHVQCSVATPDAGGNIVYYAIPVKDAAIAARTLSLATTAITAGRTLSIEFTSGKNTDLTGASFGCASTNCRFLVAVTLK